MRYMPSSCHSSLSHSVRKIWANSSQNRRYCCSRGLPLHLTNTFTKQKEAIRIRGQPVIVNSPTTAAAGSDRLTGLTYCCGPTVYADCHLGHAFSYVRFDMIRRTLAAYCATDLMLCMGVTDIDDKILETGRSSGQDWKALTIKFFNSFVEDMGSLNCQPPHVYARVTDHMLHIMEYIRRLETTGHAYVNEQTGDVVFNSSAIPALRADLTRFDEQKSTGKKSHRDFVLWKRRKPNEPSFPYTSATTGKTIDGRPGWHVECAAIVSAVFNGVDHIDFHFGGQDLIFPHHYSESACWHAHTLGHCNDATTDGSEVTAWCSHWLHSGHLVVGKDGTAEKMSKSLGNVVSIKHFLSTYSQNIVRIICLQTGTRTNVSIEDLTMRHASDADTCLKRLSFLIEEGIRSAGTGRRQQNDPLLDDLITKTEEQIVTGIADDMNYSTGLEAVDTLFNELKDRQNLPFTSLVKAQLLLSRWFSATGLVYGSIGVTESSAKQPASLVTELLSELTAIRSQVRDLGMELTRSQDVRGGQLLKLSDDIRSKLMKQGVLVRDSPKRSGE